VGDQIIKARPGSYLFGPRDVPHAFTVDSGPARLLFIFSPAGLEGLIREMGEPARSMTVPPQPEEEPDEAEMERMAASLPGTERKSWDLHRTNRNASPAPVRVE
jgi:hypothetical protein